MNCWNLFKISELQIYVRATDLGTPPKTSEQQARINVRVTRNTFAPQWAGTPYKVKINENQGTNTKIIQVRAEDRDPDGPFR